MKAKDYAKRLRDNHNDEEIVTIAHDFLKEIFALIDSRHAKTDAAVCSIFDELDNKWHAFAREFPGEIIPDGFCLVVKETMPDMYDAWMIVKRNGGRTPVNEPFPGQIDLDKFWNKLYWGGK